MGHLQKPKRTTLSAQIIEQMERCIKDGVWPVGTRIPGETELMESFGVSRNTVREATLSLVHAGLLQATPGNGTYVISSDWLDAVLQKRLKSAKLREIMEVRYTLEVDIARLAAKYSTDDDLTPLKLVNSRCSVEELSAEEFIECDLEFHMQVARLCHNKLMFDLYASCNSFIEDSIRLYEIKSDNHHQREEHQALYEAIVAHNPDAAVESAKKILDMEKELFTAAGIL